ncbi:hypothetical protein C8J56DRAFT_952087 [Mycena floridula]|nr:hypothetical protein C8J56DRAFT_952087 [Mycena floridula]
MFVPFLTKRQETKLYRRKGGGGGGKGGGGGAKGGSSGGGSGAGAGRGSSVGTSTGSKSATPFSSGGGKVTTIPSGSLFAGRQAGGGTRDQVYGTSTYGSGYPGVSGRGVVGRSFPFYFWPLAWGGAAGAGTGAYLHNSEYGRYDNTSRPGGVMTYAIFPSNSGNTTFRLVADKTTVSDLITDITAACTSSLNTANTSTSPVAFSDTDASSPKPESAVEYYRASSVALTLDGYNNTGALGDEGTPDTPLPSNIDVTLLNCLNSTIGTAVPLVDGAGARWSSPHVGSIALVSVIWWLVSV